jgi:hypothetical protein
MFIPKFREYSSLFAPITLAACQHAGVPATNASSATQPNIVLAAPKPTASTNAVGTRPAGDQADPSPFVDVVRLGYRARLNVAGQRAFLSTDKLLLGLYDDAVRIEPALLEGLQQGRSQFPRVFGDMPESGWLVQTSYEERSSRSSLSRWTGSEWQNADSLLRHKNVIGISPWNRGRTLLLIASDYEKQLEFVQLGKTGGALPQLPRAGRDHYACVHGIQPAAMSALSSGEVYLAGTRCSVSASEEVTSHGVIIDSWAPGMTRPQVSVLPGLSEKEAASGEIVSIVAASAGDLLVAGIRVANAPEGTEAKEEAYLAHFDGKLWRTFSAPPIERLDELQRTPDGRLWALNNGELWTTIGAGSETAVWQRVAMPRVTGEAGDSAVDSFWVQDDERVWATVGNESFTYLVRTKPGTAPLSVPSDEQVAQLTSAFDPMAAYPCQSPTLVLAALSRQAPRDADMPRVRAALRAHAELQGKVQLVELPFLTRRYVGARGDMDTLLSTQAILVAANIPGVDPEIRCLNSSPTRTLALDFSGPSPEQPPTPGLATKGL